VKLFGDFSRSQLATFVLLSCLCQCPECPFDKREDETVLDADKGTAKNGPLRKDASLKMKEQKLKNAPAPGAPLKAGGDDDVRLAFAGIKAGFAAGITTIDREDTGSFDARLTLAIDSSEGLDDTSEARLDFHRPPDDLGDNWSVGVRWDTEANGLVAFARMNGQDKGTPLTFADTWQVDVRMELTDDEVIFSARPNPPGQTLEGGAPYQAIHTAAQAPSEVPFQFALSALVGTGARFFFDFLHVDGPELGGAAERPLIDAIGIDITLPLDNLEQALGGGSPDLAAASLVLGDVLESIASSKSNIESAHEEDSLQASTQWKKARGALGKAAKFATKAQKLCDKGDTAKAEKIGDQVHDAWEHAVLAMANLAGFKSSAYGKLPLAFAPPPP
jgi:hypothetical protein